MAKQKIKVIREEMLQVANNVAQEKNIDQDSVFSAMEQALEKSARIKYGFDISNEYIKLNLSQLYEFTTNSNYHKQQGRKYLSSE